MLRINGFKSSGNYPNKEYLSKEQGVITYCFLKRNPSFFSDFASTLRQDHPSIFYILADLVSYCRETNQKQRADHPLAEGAIPLRRHRCSNARNLQKEGRGRFPGNDRIAGITRKRG